MLPCYPSRQGASCALDSQGEILSTTFLTRPANFEAELVGPVARIAEAAGATILKHYGAGSFAVSHKADASPLTLADLAANALICKALRDLTPDVPIVTEETEVPPFALRRKWHRFWLVDPLDGTKEFLSRNGEFTVNIALVAPDRPVLGVVHAPTLQRTYYAVRGGGAWMSNRSEPPQRLCPGTATAPRKLCIVASRSHGSPDVEAFITRLQDVGHEVECIGAGSSLKFCLCAEGSADIYPRFGTTMEWDTAAGQIIAEEAGHVVREVNTMKTLSYNKTALHNPHFVVHPLNWSLT